MSPSRQVPSTWEKRDVLPANNSQTDDFYAVELSYTIHGENMSNTPVPAATTTTSKLDAAKAKAVEFVQTDVTEAAWRTAANQLTKLVREPLVALLARNLNDDSPEMRKRLSEFLDTEMGGVLITAVLSVGMSAMPPNPKTERLGRELRIKAMADTGDVVADVLMGPLRQVMALYIQDGTGPAPMLGQLGQTSSLPMDAPVMPNVKDAHFVDDAKK
jgi:hypothetical protein